MRQTSKAPAKTEWIEAPAGSGMRLDQLLGTVPEIRSRSQAQKHIEAGFVRISGKIETKASRMLRPTDSVEYWLPTVTVPDEGGTDLDLEVLYEDDDCFVINKPAGIAVHPGSGMTKGEVTLLDGLKLMFRKRKLPYSASTVLVHRLDKETTGCLLIAKNPEAHRTLQKQFESRSVQKFYLALVAGVPSPAAATIDAPIGRHTGDRTKMSIIQTSTTRNATTTYRTLGSAKGAALLSCELHTGRTHQIRVHLRGIDHPILGDEKYGTAKSTQVTAGLGIDFLCLHAWKLSFLSSKKKVEVVCPLPLDIKKILKMLNISVSV